MPRLPPLPDLDWTPEGAPRSTSYGDIYFSREGGLAETDAVFIGGCGLPDGWRGRSRYSIGELGFGCGLNALAVWRAWRERRDPGAVLHFVSVEGFLMDVDAAQKALEPFAEVAPLAQRLLTRWPVRARATQRLWFPEDGFALTVIVDDVAAALARIDHRFDAWFLDGFAPARNPDMWSPEVMAKIAARSAPGCRLATYSVAAAVREGLAGAGFVVQRKPGFGSKRDRLEAQLPGALAPSTPPGTIAVVGAGVAGASVAQALARRSVPCTIFDQAGPGRGASGNPAGLVMPRFDRGETPAARLFLTAYLAATALYANAPLGVFDQSGVVEPATLEEASAWAADPPLPRDWLIAEGARLFHPRGGVVTPPAVLTWMLDQTPVRPAAVETLMREGGAWRLRDPSGVDLGAFDAVILASGPALGGFAETRWLPLSLTRGQIDFGPLEGPPPPHAIAAGAYAAPCAAGLVFGATFDKLQSLTAVTPDADSTARNLAALADLAPGLAARVDRHALASRASVRAATPDRLPFAGSAPDVPRVLEMFAPLAHGGKAPLGRPPALAGLHLFGGLGARGFLVAPLLAEALASDLLHEPSPLDAEIRAAVDPARFLLRAIKKGRRLIP